jgi:hypothetical protein
MPGPLAWLAAISWPMVLKQAPAVLAAADAMLERSRRRSGEHLASTDVEALRQRIAELEQQQQAAAVVVKQLADHIDVVTLAAQASSVRTRQALILATVGVVVGLVACLLAW